jgi:hypothetical protein
MPQFAIMFHSLHLSHPSRALGALIPCRKRNGSVITGSSFPRRKRRATGTLGHPKHHQLHLNWDGREKYCRPKRRILPQMIQKGVYTSSR